MKDKLIELANNSYSPYSKYRVATILVMKDGTEINGVNVENASYGSTICAERSAIVAAISQGYKKGDFKELHCMCLDSNKISTSCFGCRQVISEFFDKDAPLYFYNRNGDFEKYAVSEICPYPFESDDLK
ncbi:MAG: cytidine deaminase [Bacilli bacterium]|nr:cytidine deaminase [Bacilli bacterium]